MATTANPFQTQIDDLTNKSQVTPVTNTFDESKGVEGRVNSIIKTDSPLMQTAATRAKQQANARGLRNSSMAVQAGQQAVIETATPIAGADAQLFQQQGLANQTAQNQAAHKNADLTASIGLEGMNLGQKDSQFGKSLMEQARQFDSQMAQQGGQFDKNLALQQSQLDAQREQFAQSLGMDAKQLELQRDQLTQQQQQYLGDLELKGRELEQQKTLAQMDADSRRELANIEAGFKAEIAGNENIANAWGTMMSEIGKIQNNPDLEAGAKKTQIENTLNSFRSFSNFWKKASGGAVDVTDLLDFGATEDAAAPAPAPMPDTRRPAPDYFSNPELYGGA